MARSQEWVGSMKLRLFLLSFAMLVSSAAAETPDRRLALDAVPLAIEEKDVVTGR